MLKVKLKNIKILNSLLLVVYFYILRYLYIRDIYPVYEYYGFKNDYNLLHEIIAILILCITCIILSFSRTSTFIYSVAFIFTIFSLIPNAIIYIYTNTSVWILLGCLSLIVFILIIGNIRLNIKINTLKSRDQTYVLLVILFLLITPFFITFGFKPNFNIFSLGAEVYDVRLAARDVDNVFTGYTSNWLTNVILPICIILGLQMKKYALLLVSIICMIYLFTCYATKTVFLSIPMIVFFYFGNHIKKTFSLFLIILFLLFITLICFPEATDAGLFKAILLNRALFIPALLNTHYFDFFHNSPIYLSGSIFKYFIAYPYSSAPAFVIGENYFNQPGMSANNGFPGDGYMNFGIPGILIFNIIIALVFSIINSLKVSNKFFGIYFILIINFISTSIFTVFLTHGLILLLIVSIFFLKNTRNIDATY